MREDDFIIPELSLEDRKRIQAMSIEEKRRIYEEYEEKFGMFKIFMGTHYDIEETIYIVEICLRENITNDRIRFENQVDPPPGSVI